MGKKSLIKSTSKKKTAPAPKDEENKDAAPQAPSAKPKSGAKSKTAAEKKEVSRKDLIFKKFETYPPEKLYSAAAIERGPEEFIAPPYITASSQEEITRIRKLLFNRYGIEDLTVAAEKAAAEKAAAEKAAAEKAAAEKAAAEKAAAEKAAAEKAAAEKAAAEKAAAEKAAAEKAAAEKAAAEKAAAEKAAAEKAAAEKAAAEKAAAEKAAAEKAAAEKAAAEKAAAEKAAAEKAAAEKAAAEKAAAEKAAAEKAAAEKAAAEKAAAEKAAAEKAAAEKAAAEKAAAEKVAAKSAEAAKLAAEPKVSVSYDTPFEKPKKGLDPVEKATKILAAGIALLILLVVGASFSNSGNYYLKSKDGALEIWKGRFAPMGEELIFSLPGVQMPQTVQPVYGKKDVFPLAFNYYIDKADALLQVEGLPDFEGIKSYVDQALAFSVSDKMTESGLARLNNIDRLILIFKADVATSRGTLEDLKAARQYLKDADAISRQPADEALIAEKMKGVEEAMAALKAAEAENTAAPQPKESAE
jgi:hypothetical protein